MLKLNKELNCHLELNCHFGGRQIMFSKQKYFTFFRKTDHINLQICGETLNKMEKFEYLGITIDKAKRSVFKLVKQMQ